MASVPFRRKAVRDKREKLAEVSVELMDLEEKFPYPQYLSKATWKFKKKRADKLEKDIEQYERILGSHQSA